MVLELGSISAVFLHDANEVMIKLSWIPRYKPFLVNFFSQIVSDKDQKSSVIQVLKHEI